MVRCNFLAKFLTYKKIVVDALFLYKDTLGVADKITHVRGESRSHHFGDEFCNGVDEANRPKVHDVLGPI